MTLCSFLNGGDDPKPKIFTKLNNPVINSQERQALGAAYDFTDYRKKVNRYVEEYKEDPVIYKLNHNLCFQNLINPITAFIIV